MRSPASPLPVLLGAVFLTGCTLLGPDFTGAPEVSLERWDRTLHGLAEPEAGGEAASEAWWRLFGDPVLERLVEAARLDNLSLRQAGLRILQARALAGIAGAGRYPQLRQATVEAVYENRQDHGGAGEVGSDQGLFRAGLAVAWELDFWGRFRRAIESADADFFASIEAQQALQVLIRAQVAALYFEWRILGLRIEIARRNARLQRRSLQIAAELHESGNTSELDLQQARTQHLATLAVIPRLRLERRRIRNALALLLGRAPGDLPELEEGGYRLPEVPDPVIRGLPARLLLRRPDVRAAAWAVAGRSARIGIAEADLYPAISLAGSLGWSATTAAGLPDSGILALGPGLRWNLFDQGLIRNNVRLQDALLQEQMEAYRQVVLEAAREVDDAAAGVVRTGEQVRILEQTVAAAERALEIARTRYREGYADFQRVLDAQRSLFTQQDRLVGIRGERIAWLIALYKGLGGGWSPVTLDQAVPETTRKLMKRRTDWGDLLDRPLPPSLPDPVRPEAEAASRE